LAVLEMEVLRTICLSWPWTRILLISASQVVGLQVWATGAQQKINFESHSSLLFELCFELNLQRHISSLFPFAQTLAISVHGQTNITLKPSAPSNLMIFRVYCIISWIVCTQIIKSTIPKTKYTGYIRQWSAMNLTGF
jgi:hypothetical protein